MSTLAALAKDLADRSDAALARLFALRPDAMTPPVASFADLASRLSAPHSVNLALDQLPLPALQTLLPEPATHCPDWLPALHGLALVIETPDHADDGGAGHFLPVAAVALALSAGPVLEPVFQAAPPPPVAVPVSRALRDNAAGSAIEFLLRTMTALLERIQLAPLVSLRGGGIGVRLLRALSRELEIEETLLCFHLDLADRAGLVFLDDHARLWRASAGEWLSLGRPAQWFELAWAWLVGERNSPTLAGPPPAVRQQVLAAVLQLAAPGVAGSTPLEGGQQISTSAATAAPALPSTMDLLAWRQPRQSPGHMRQIPCIVHEMEILGLTGAGAPSGPGLTFGLGLACGPGLTFGPGLACGSGLAYGPGNGRAAAAKAAIAAVSALLPEPIGHFVIQGDLTAIAPGFLAPPISARLKIMAAQEGRGAAGIFRFGQASLESAMAAGVDQESIRSFLQEHSSTAVPQSLSYLITEAARRTEMTAPVSAALPAPPAAQHKPRSGVGQAWTRQARQGQARQGQARQGQARPAQAGAAAPLPAQTAPNDKDIAAQIAHLRSQPVWDAHGSGEAGPALVMEELRQAIKAGEQVRLRVATGAGDVETVLTDPVSLEAGTLRTRLPGTTRERRFSIHRIVAAEAVEQEERTWHG